MVPAKLNHWNKCIGSPGTSQKKSLSTVSKDTGVWWEMQLRFPLLRLMLKQHLARGCPSPNLQPKGPGSKLEHISSLSVCSDQTSAV